MTHLIMIGIGFLMGVLLFPFLLFVRARRSPAWDRSNMMNIYRVIAHLGTRPEDFADMRYSDGRRPFWYIGKDEFSGVVKTNRVGRKSVVEVQDVSDGRRIFSVDVGSMPSEKASRYLEQVRAAFGTADMTPEQTMEALDKIQEFVRDQL